MPYITIMQGKRLVSQWPLLGNVITIGRGGLTIDDSPDIVLPDKSRNLSRYHAAFVRNKDGNFFIRDLGSTQFTYVNGELTFRRMLADNDRINMGQFTIQFKTDDIRCDDVPGILVLDDHDAINGEFRHGTTLPQSSNKKTRHGVISSLSRKFGKEILDYLSAMSTSQLPSDLLLEVVCGFFEATRGLISDYTAGVIKSLASIGINPFLGDLIRLSSSHLHHAIQNGHIVLNHTLYQNAVICISVSLRDDHHRILVLERPDSNPFRDEEVQILISLRGVLGNLVETCDRTMPDDMPSSSYSCFEWKEWFIGSTAKMRHVRKEIRMYARKSMNIFLFGETGTGKELAARFYHESSPKSDGKLIAIDLPSLPTSIIEAELFGSIRGAFAGAIDRVGYMENANGGTLFLDEIGDIDGVVQGKLRRAIQERCIYRVGETKPRKIDLQLVSATNNEIRSEADTASNFRQDLRWRLGDLIKLPPLRERIADIPLLVCHFIDSLKCPVEGISNAAMRRLIEFDFPGNVRQLSQIVRRLAREEKRVLFSFDIQDNTESTDQSLAKLGDFKSLDEMEKQYIKRVLKHTGNNKDKAAKILGRSKSTLYNKLKTYGLDIEGID